MDANHGVELRVEVGLAAKDFGGDLIFLHGDARMLDGLFGKITEKLAERFGTVKSVTAYQTLDFSEKLRSVNHGDSGDIDVT